MEYFPAFMVVAVVGLLIIICLNAVFYWKDRRYQQYHVELSKLISQGAQQDRIESRKFWERADKRWADHEQFMRMIFERVEKRDE